MKMLSILSMCIISILLLKIPIFAQFGQGQTPMQVAGTPSITATQSGDWTSTSTWGGSLPNTDARISIPAGITVTVDAEISTEFKSINIAGTLKFATNTDTELRCEYFHSTPTGTLEIGTINNPIAANVTAKIVIADRGGTSAQDWWRYAPGMVLMGPVSMHGENKTTWLELASGISAGTTSMTLASTPTNWKVGDKLVLAATTPQDFESDDVVTIQNINGTAVTFSPATQYDHEPPAQANHLKVHVANYTRNIKISSETTGYFPGPSNTNQRRRGHIMFMHNHDVDMRYVEVENMGRTLKTESVDDFQSFRVGDQVMISQPWVPGDFHPDLDPEENQWGDNTNPRGRYSIHFHRSLDDVSESLFANQIPKATVQGVSVFDDPGWGFVSHSSSVDFIENASYGVVGGAFNTESGDEIGSFVNNIALRTLNPTDPYANPANDEADLNLREGGMDFAFQGDAFWFHSNGVTVQGNVAAGVSGHAYVFWPEGQIEAGRGQRRGIINRHIDDAAMRTLVTNYQSANSPDTELWPNGIDWQFDCWHIPAQPFVDNTAYSASKGVSQFYGHSRFLNAWEGPSPEDAPLSPGLFNVVPEAFRDMQNIQIEGTKIWNIRNAGIQMQYTSHVTIKDNEVYGYDNPGTVQGRQVIGIDVDHWHNFDNWLIEGNTVMGFANGGAGIAPPDNATSVILRNNTYDNPSTDLQIGSRTFVGLPGDVGYFQYPDWPDFIPVPGRVMTVENETFLNSQDNIVLEADLRNAGDMIVEDGAAISDTPKNPYYFLYKDEITLTGFGPFNNSRLYFDEQDASFIPITNSNYRWINEEVEPGENPEFVIPTIYRNKTNQQLTTTGESNGQSFGGEITPETAESHAMIVGGKVIVEDGPLAVDLLDFYGEEQNQTHHLYWKIGLSDEPTVYEIEQADAKLDFKKIGEISDQTTNGKFHFVNTTLLKGSNYYRLKMIDQDGKFTHSGIIQLSHHDVLSDVTLFPNPSSGTVYLALKSQVKDELMYAIVNAQGQLMQQNSQVMGRGNNRLQLDLSDLPAGIYWMTVRLGSGDGQVSRRIVKLGE